MNVPYYLTIAKGLVHFGSEVGKISYTLFLWKIFATVCCIVPGSFLSLITTIPHSLLSQIWVLASWGLAPHTIAIPVVIAHHQYQSHMDNSLPLRRPMMSGFASSLSINTWRTYMNSVLPRALLRNWKALRGYQVDGTWLLLLWISNFFLFSLFAR